MRRLELLAFVIGILATMSLTYPAVAAEPKYVRQSLSEYVKDPTKLRSLILGILEMKRRSAAPPNSAEYRTSWEYWANIHGYPGPRSSSGTVEQVRAALAAPLYSGFFDGLKDLTPPDSLAEEVWATCEHGDISTPAIHFMSWHRMYLFFFERTLRAASGDLNFALPYWDYTNTAVGDAPGERPWAMPTLFGVEELTTTAGPIANPLYERRRTTGFATTVQIDIGSGITNVDAVLALRSFFEFQAAIETGVHALIHCAVGNGCLAPYIGVVPFAGNDPIFWLHHANIDRLWQCWTTRNGPGANPVDDAAWMNKTYVFVDENGRRVEMKVAELFDPNGRIDYTYDNVDRCFRQDPGTPRIAAASRILAARTGARADVVALGSAKAVDLNRTRRTVVLAPSPSRNARAAASFAAKADILSPSAVRLVLNGIELGEQPGASVAVHLVDPHSQRRKIVGVLGFFGWADRAAHHGGRAIAGGGRSVTFDVTAAYRELFGARPTSANPHVAFVAASGLAGDAREVDSARYKAAGLRIREIRLDVESSPFILDLK